MFEDFDIYIDKRDLKRIKDKDLFETVEEVFDTRTVLTLYTLMRKKIIKRMNGVISAGKESRVYLAYSYSDEPLAVKIYLTSTAVFRKGILKYIMGDPRFQGFKPSDTRKLIYMWTRKEFRNMKRMYDADVKVPKPIAFLNNVLVMEFLGEDNKRYPLLIEVYNELELEDLHRIYSLVLEELVKIVCRARLVHGDLSEYNIMVRPGIDIAIIDVSQAVDLEHPNFYDFLIRDIRNINRFFRYEVGLDSVLDEETVLERIKPCLVKRKEG
ncbi:MAG: serine/threonine protein kinase [Desulfurococcales archaeon ex4484_58]|nr:MAG: serine/threonine protein kinase [Desulfurococcales archaeon ex4484_58]